MNMRSAYDVLEALDGCARWVIEQETAVAEIGDDAYVSELRDVLDQLHAARDAMAATIPGTVPLDSNRRKTVAEIVELLDAANPWDAR